MSIIDRRLKYDKWKNELKKLDNSFVEIGLIRGNKVASGNKTAKVKPINLLSELARIAIYLEKGVPAKAGSSKRWRIPPRPFFKSAMIKYKTDIEKMQVLLLSQVAAGNLNTEKALALLGEFVSSKIKQRIRDIKTPKNAPSTVKYKGFDNPLIHTGQLRNSIDHKVIIK